MNILVLNSGSASLRFEVIATPESHTTHEKRSTLVSGIVEGIGEEATFSLLENKQTIRKEKIDASDYGAATRHLLKWLDAAWQDASTTHQLDAVGHRIVHGGDRFTESVVINSDVIVGMRSWKISHRYTTPRRSRLFGLLVICWETMCR
jgi:acetate kinase